MGADVDVLLRLMRHACVAAIQLPAAEQAVHQLRNAQVSWWCGSFRGYRHESWVYVYSCPPRVVADFPRRQGLIFTQFIHIPEK